MRHKQRSFALFFVVAVALACGIALASVDGFTSLYAFTDGPDGSRPNHLIALDGTLYGTTSAGTIFEMKPSGAQRVLDRLNLTTEGVPSGLAGLKGALYGTTFDGGGSGCFGRGCGTIFMLDASGARRVIYRFKGTADGMQPDGSMVAMNSLLYGTTEGGGTLGCMGNGRDPTPCGTVYEVNGSGMKRTIYRFVGGKDGGDPLGLIAANGVLYGVTQGGGSSGCYGHGCGTIFTVSTSGTERVLHRFKGGTDGEAPMAIAEMNGSLYGITASGGGPWCDNDDGCGEAFEGGTIFSISQSGEKRTLYRFKGGADGVDPNSLIAIDGVLYGTTLGGGTGCMSRKGGGNGCGTVFAVTPAGKERVLYRFTGGSDGASPNGLTAFDGALYGTAWHGGNNGCYEGQGCGTVFTFSLKN